MDILKDISKQSTILKAVGDGNTVTALVTTFGNKDSVGDVIEKGALDKYVKAFNSGKAGVLRMLKGHNRQDIIGKWNKLEITDKGVIATGELFVDTTIGKDVRVLIDKGVLNEVSIGFQATDYKFSDDEDGIVFKEIQLVEVSIVDKAANQSTSAVSIKSDDGSINPRALEQHLREADLSKSEAQSIVRIAKELFQSEREVQDEAMAMVKALKNLNKPK